ncbi:MAG TPA: glycosyltransferase [Polyangiaceae bacterium]
MSRTTALRVLQVGKYYYPHMGGIESHLYTLCNELKPHVSTEVVVCNSTRRTVRESIDGIPVTRCAELFHAASVSVCPEMPLALSRGDYSILHVHHPHPMGELSYLTSKKPRRHRLVMTYHSDIVRQARLVKLYAPFLRAVMARADAIVCTSPNYLESSSVLAPFREKCRVIPYGIDPSQFALTPDVAEKAAAIRARYPGRLLVGIGRLIYYKGFEVAIQAMRDIDARLLLIGEGPLRESLEALARETGVAERVHFLGNIHNHEIAPYHHASDLFVLPSIVRSEAFGIVQLEAMACGRPVVNTLIRDSGVPFVSRHGETGLTVEPKDPRARARAVNELLADPERTKRFGEAARRRVETEFDKTVMAGRVLSLYREISG